MLRRTLDQRSAAPENSAIIVPLHQPITTAGDPRVAIEENTSAGLRVRTLPNHRPLGNVAIAGFVAFLCWNVWDSGSKLLAWTRGAVAHGSVDALFSIAVGFGLTTALAGVLCLGALWIGYGFQRLVIVDGILEYESRLGSVRLTHRRAALSEITGMSITEVGAQANDDVQAIALVIVTARWKVQFGAVATLSVLKQILGELERLKAESALR